MPPPPVACQIPRQATCGCLYAKGHGRLRQGLESIFVRRTQFYLTLTEQAQYPPATHCSVSLAEFTPPSARLVASKLTRPKSRFISWSGRVCVRATNRPTHAVRSTRLLEIVI